MAEDGLFSSLPSPNSPALRLNAICPYYTMFPLRFPFITLRHAREGDWVLDPFCGRGTTNFAARLRGLSSVGIDSNPVAAAITAAKTVSVTPKEVSDLCYEILFDSKDPEAIPSGPFWELCYHQSTLEDICKLRTHLLEEKPTDARIALRALMLGILHGPRLKGAPTYLSNQMPRTYATKPDAAVRFWAKRQQRPTKVDVGDVVRRRTEFSFAVLPRWVFGSAILADSRKLHELDIGGPFQWVITSPPYYGMRTYWSDQWIRNWFLGGPPTVTYEKNAQLSHGGEESFVRELGAVWRQVAHVCSPGARLIVRFGALPSVPKEPVALLKQSLKVSDSGWRVLTVRGAGDAACGNRQSEQFGHGRSSAIDEVDLYAVKES